MNSSVLNRIPASELRVSGLRSVVHIAPSRRSAPGSLAGQFRHCHRMQRAILCRTHRTRPSGVHFEAAVGL
eukprot:8318078-Alexandrium_andersonii.AAC.1